MIIPDVNLLLYVHHPTMAEHGAARKWWERLLSGSEPVGISWVVLVGFIRISTSRRIFINAISPAEALAATDAWFEVPVVHILEPGPEHYAIFRRLVSRTTGGNLVTDAYLAALAIENNATLHSNDGDFARFSGLRWVNPLSA